jgi:hypothetical protein
MKSKSNLAMVEEQNPVMVEAFGSEDDAKRCVDFMRPKIQAYFDYAFVKHRHNLDGVAWALTWGFSDTLAQFEANDRTMLERSVAQYAAVPQGARAAARDCQKRVQAILTATKQEGFSTTALAWSMLGALSNIQGQMLRAYMPARPAMRKHDKIVENLIVALNKARRTTLH